MPYSVCFDLDGTLIDTAPDLVHVLNLVLQEAGLPATDFQMAHQHVSYGAKRLILTAYDHAQVPISQTELDKYQDRFLKLYASNIAQFSRPYPDVPEVLGDLQSQGVSLSVCTNKPGDLARTLLKTLQLNHLFERIIGGDDIAHKKPHPEHIFAAAGHKGDKPIIMVGDSTPDILAAHNAGVPCVLMTYGYESPPTTQLKATKYLNAFRDIPQAFRQILR